MKRFAELKPPPIRRRMDIECLSQNVAVFLPPRRVVHFGYDRFKRVVLHIEAIVKADRIETMAEIPQVGEQPDRALGTSRQSLLDQVFGPPSRAES